ncbi:MAG: HAD family hydrolase [Desulfovibrio sp.]|jgi:HAD superfamily hydrolase (TIGR01509 family)|nr:HAD family hydrolase [Desulfovibrio sp.]
MMTSLSSELFPDGLTGVVFDCDGVMIDSREANREYYNRILAFLGLPAMTAEQEVYAFMATARGALRAMVPEDMHPRLEYAATVAVNYGRDVMPLLRLSPGFRDFIQWLRQRGLRMSIATNRVDAALQTVLDFFDLPDYFNPMVTASKAAPKPSPECVRLVCDTWGVKPHTVLFVGDSESDRQAAAGGGAVFAAFNNNALEGHLRVGDFAALRLALEDVGAARKA